MDIASHNIPDSGRFKFARRFACFVMGFGFAAIFFPIGASGEEEPKHPNVLIVLTDDQGYGDVASHGNNYLQTPFHDRIAANGARFNRFFVSPVCAPTRASLLTGRWHLRTGVHGVTRGQETMRASETTMAELFAAAGFATAAVGKWHNGAHYPEHPLGQGFHEFYGFCSGHFNNYFDSQMERNGELVSFEGFMIDRQTDYAIDFIKRHTEQPWFCYVAFNTPHSPWQVAESYWRRFANQSDLPDDKARCAYAMVENIDDNLGRLLKAIDDQQQTKDTIVIFLTDNGANSNRYNAEMRGRKGSLHEGGSRVPCFIQYPRRIKPRQTIAPIAAHIDLLPTLCDLARVPLPSALQIDGKSLVPLLDGQADKRQWPERTLFTHWGNNESNQPRTDRGAVRTERYRAVMERGVWQLFDMVQDPSQRVDVAKAHPAQLATLKMAYSEWFSDVTRAGFQRIPIQIGHRQAERINLPGHEAILSPERGAKIKYQGRAGWANDWVTGWKDQQAYPGWPINVIEEGRYRVSLEYAATEAQTKNRLKICIDGQPLLVAPIEQPALKQPIPCPDRVPRTEVPEFKWGNRTLGSIDLPAGVHQFEVRVETLATEELMELKSVTLERVEANSNNK